MDRLVMLCLSFVTLFDILSYVFVSSDLPEEELKQDEEDEQAKEKDS